MPSSYRFVVTTWSVVVPGNVGPLCCHCFCTVYCTSSRNTVRDCQHGWQCLSLIVRIPVPTEYWWLKKTSFVYSFRVIWPKQSQLMPNYNILWNEDPVIYFGFRSDYEWVCNLGYIWNPWVIYLSIVWSVVIFTSNNYQFYIRVYLSTIE